MGFWDTLGKRMLQGMKVAEKAVNSFNEKVARLEERFRNYSSERLKTIMESGDMQERVIAKKILQERYDEAWMEKDNRTNEELRRDIKSSDVINRVVAGQILEKRLREEIEKIEKFTPETLNEVVGNGTFLEKLAAIKIIKNRNDRKVD